MGRGVRGAWCSVIRPLLPFTGLFSPELAMAVDGVYTLRIVAAFGTNVMKIKLEATSPARRSDCDMYAVAFDGTAPYRGTSLIRNQPPPSEHHRSLGICLL